MQAVLKGDSELKIEELKKVVSYGEKLGKDVTPDKKKLEILLGREEKKLKSSATKEDNDIPTNRAEFTIEEYLPKNNKPKSIENKKENNETLVKKDESVAKKFSEIKIDDKKEPTTLLVTKIEKAEKKEQEQKQQEKEDKKTEKTELLNKVEEKKDDNSLEDKKSKLEDDKDGIKLISAKESIIKIDFLKAISKDDIKYLSYKLNDNFENIIDIKSSYSDAKDIKISLANVDKITVLPKNNGKNTRIKLSNNSKLKLSYILKNKQLIIKVDVTKSSNNKDNKELSKNSKVENTKEDNKIDNENLKNIFPLKTSNKSKVIVIDPGHGGKDPGAIGFDKRVEKIVTFEVAKMVYNKLKQNGHKVYLTRNKDKFIKVADRTVLANEKNADIFISIHCNSIVKSKANHVQGIETYFLSPARNERAKRVAEKENIEDTSGMSDSTKSAFLESLNRPRITASHKLSIDIHAGMLQNAKNMYKKVEDAGVKEGPFWVLVGAQMPSVLIELGYISHPTESEYLYNKKYQKLLANGIANGVESYFSKNP